MIQVENIKASKDKIMFNHLKGYETKSAQFTYCCVTSWLLTLHWLVTNVNNDHSVQNKHGCWIMIT